MALEVGVDSYITIAQADEIISKAFISTDSQRSSWAELEDDDKEIVLRNATELIETIKWTGRKKELQQVLSFPRCYPNRNMRPSFLLDNTFVALSNCQSDVPEQVKKAQAFEALELAVPSKDTSVFNSYTSNVKSYSTIGLSKTFKTGSFGSTKITGVIRSRRAQNLLIRFESGGFRID